MANKAPELGSKKRAGFLLSSYLRAIAQEMIARDDTDSGETRTMCKAEALAHLIWSKALGYTEEVVDEDGDKVIVHHEADKDMIKLIYERMEGKTTNSEETKHREQTLPDKVSGINKDRLNKAAEASGNND